MNLTGHSSVRLGRAFGTTAGKGAGALALVLLAALFYSWYSASDKASPRFVNIGIVQLTEVDSQTFEGFKAGMADLGYREGENVRYRHPGPARSIERLDEIIAEHLAANVDLMLVSSTPAAQAAKRATAQNRLPVVFAPVNDPLQAGVVTSLRAPGENITGVRLPQGDGLRLLWLLKVVPGIRRILFPFNPDDASALESLRQIKELSDALRLELLPQPVENEEAISRSLANLPAAIDAVVLPRDSSVEAHISDYVAVALERKLPLCAPSLTQTHAGALLSYGFVHREIGRQAARLAVQILHGVPPADIPVETARNYLALNIKTGKSIGLRLPHEVLRQAHLLVR